MEKHWSQFKKTTKNISFAEISVQDTVIKRPKPHKVQVHSSKIGNNINITIETEPDTEPTKTQTEPADCRNS